jgi:hypothetical protein
VHTVARMARLSDFVSLSLCHRIRKSKEVKKIFDFHRMELVIPLVCEDSGIPQKYKAWLSGMKLEWKRAKASVAPRYELFGERFLLAREKTPEKTEASFPVALSPSPQERFADLSDTSTLRGSDLFQMILKV